MPWLSACLLAALLAQALGLALEPVAAGRIRAVVAILGQARLQVADVGPQLLDLLTLLDDLLALLSDDAFQVGDTLIRGHRSMLHPLRKSV